MNKIEVIFASVILAGCAETHEAPLIRASALIYDPSAPGIIYGAFVYDPAAPPIRSSGFQISPSAE
jgi:hypothetical protein